MPNTTTNEIDGFSFTTRICKQCKKPVGVLHVFSVALKGSDVHGEAVHGEAAHRTYDVATLTVTKQGGVDLSLAKHVCTITNN